MQLLGRAEQEVAAADNFCYAHQGIIHYYCQLISPSAVPATEDVVATMLCKVDVLLAVMLIAETYHLVWHDETDGSRWQPPPNLPLGGGVFIFAAASAGIDDASVRFVRCLRRHDVGSRAEARVGEACILKLLEIMLVDVTALTLPDDLVVPGKSKPLQVLLQLQGIVAT